MQNTAGTSGPLSSYIGTKTVQNGAVCAGSVPGAEIENAAPVDRRNGAFDHAKAGRLLQNDTRKQSRLGTRQRRDAADDWLAESEVRASAKVAHKAIKVADALYYDGNLTKILGSKLATAEDSQNPKIPNIRMARAPANHGGLLVRKKKPTSQCRQQRIRRERLMRFQDAVVFAYSQDWPLTTAITVSWDALKQAGERNDGHCLGMASWDRERYLRKELARLCRSRGFPLAAIWGRDVGRDIGAHIHLSLFYPSSRLAELVALIERLTGSTADFVLKPYAARTVARSVCGGWQIDMNYRDKAGALFWADYIAGQHDKHPDIPELKGKAFGVSAAIGQTARQRAL